MARLFTAKSWEDDDTEIKIGMQFKISEIEKIIDALKEIQQGKESYIVFDSPEADEIEVKLQFY